MADKVTLPAPHLSAGVVLVIIGASFTVAITADLALDGQLPFTACA